MEINRRNANKLTFTTGVDDPMSKAKYGDLNSKIELMSKFLHFILTKLTVLAVMAPSIIISFMDYYINDLGEDSFSLPIQGLYVLITPDRNIWASFKYRVWPLIHQTEDCRSIGEHHLDTFWHLFWELCRRMHYASAFFQAHVWHSEHIGGVKQLPET